MRKRLMMGAEINLRKAYILYKRNEFQNSLEVLSEAIKFLRIQRKNHHTIETEDNIHKLERVVKSTWAGEDALEKGETEHEIQMPIDICRATINTAIQHFHDAKDRYRAMNASTILVRMMLNTVEGYMGKGLLEHCYPLLDDAEGVCAEVGDRGDKLRQLQRHRTSVSMPSVNEETGEVDETLEENWAEASNYVLLEKKRASYLRGSLALKHGQLDLEASKWEDAVKSMETAIDYLKNLYDQENDWEQARVYSFALSLAIKLRARCKGELFMDEGIEAVERNDMEDALVSLGRAVNFFTTAKEEGIGRLLAAKKEKAVLSITPIFRPETGEQCNVVKSNDHPGGYNDHFKLGVFCLDPDAVIQYTVIKPGSKSLTHATMGTAIELPVGQVIEVAAWGQGLEQDTTESLVSEIRDSVYRSIAPKMGVKLFEMQSWIQFKCKKVRNQTMKSFQQKRAWVMKQGICRVLQQKPALFGDSMSIQVDLHKVMKVASVDGGEPKGKKRKESRLSNEEAEREAAAGRIQEIMHKQKPELKEKRKADQAKKDTELKKIQADAAKAKNGAKNGAKGKALPPIQGGAKAKSGASEEGELEDTEWVAVRVVYSVSIHESNELRQALMGEQASLLDTETGAPLVIPVETIAILAGKVQERLSDPEQESAELQKKKRDEAMARTGGGGGGGAGRVVATISADPDAIKPFSQRFCECVSVVVDKASKKALKQIKEEEKVKEKIIRLGGSRPPATDGYIHELAHCELAPKADVATIEADRVARKERNEAEQEALKSPKSKGRTLAPLQSSKAQGKKGLLAREAEEKAEKEALEVKQAEELGKKLRNLKQVFQQRAKKSKEVHRLLKLDVWDCQSAFYDDVYDVATGRRASGVSFGRMNVGQSARSMALKDGHNQKELEMVEEMAKEAAANEKKRYARYQTHIARMLQSRYRGQCARKAMGSKSMFLRLRSSVKLQALARGFIVRCRRWHRIRRDYDRDLERKRREAEEMKKKALWARKDADLKPRVDPTEWARKRKEGKEGKEGNGGKGHGKGGKGQGGKGGKGKGKGGKGGAPEKEKEKARQGPLTAELLEQQWSDWSQQVKANPAKHCKGMPQSVADKTVLQVLEKGAKTKEAATEVLEATVVRLFFGLYGRGAPMSSTKSMGFIAWLETAIKERANEQHSFRLLFAEMLGMCDPPEGQRSLQTGCAGIVGLFVKMTVHKPKARQYLAMTNLTEASVAITDYAAMRGWGDVKRDGLLGELQDLVVIDESRSNGGVDINPDSLKWIDIKDLVLFVGQADRGK
jgi:hypothetical protein